MKIVFVKREYIITGKIASFASRGLRISSATRKVRTCRCMVVLNYDALTVRDAPQHRMNIEGRVVSVWVRDMIHTISLNIGALNNAETRHHNLTCQYMY